MTHLPMHLVARQNLLIPRNLDGRAGKLVCKQLISGNVAERGGGGGINMAGLLRVREPCSFT